MSCGVGCRCFSDPALLWLWCRPADVAPIWPLAWEFSYAVGAALKDQKNKKNITIYKCKCEKKAYTKWKSKGNLIFIALLS